jgi:hypothetical protein
MFKRKCHKYGKAIRVEGSVTHFCKCISYQEILDLWQDGKNSQLKEVENV